MKLRKHQILYWRFNKTT